MNAPATLQDRKVFFRSTLVAAKSMGSDVAEVHHLFFGAVREIFPESLATANALSGFYELMGEEGGSVGVAEAGKLHNPKDPTSRAGLGAAANRHQLIAVKDGKGEWLFPVWQFGERGGLLPGLREVLDALRIGHPAYNDLTAITFFLTHDPELSGKTPLEALREGRTAEVIERAKAAHE